eukprot:13603994-Alexandrium_andersonii.AAC.2
MLLVVLELLPFCPRHHLSASGARWVRCSWLGRQDPKHAMNYFDSGSPRDGPRGQDPKHAKKYFGSGVKIRSRS